MSNDRFKFRVWNHREQCVDHKHPDQAYINCATGQAVYYNGFAGCILEHDKYVIEQCTGLRDCNGKLIYESDHVRWVGTETVRRVVWQNSRWSLVRCDLAQANAWTDLVDTEEMEIVGNAYETQP